MTIVPAPKRGRFKIFLGYAAGVGKTYQMLEEGQEMRRKGMDVVIGYFEAHGRKDTIAQTEGLETVPRRKIEYRGTLFEEMDTDAILQAEAGSVPGGRTGAHQRARFRTRSSAGRTCTCCWRRASTCSATLNVQHLESLNDQIWQMTGVRVRETMPDWVVDQADEIVVVDVTPRALRHRLERGVIYSREKAGKALENFFTEQNLSALREIAMRHAAHEIEDKLSAEKETALAGSEQIAPSAEAPQRRECILICIDERPSSAVLIRRGRRVADYLRAECIAVYVSPDTDAGPPFAGGPRVRRAAPGLCPQSAHPDGSHRGPGRGRQRSGIRARATCHAYFHRKEPFQRLDGARAWQHAEPPGAAGARYGDYDCGRAAEIAVSLTDLSSAARSHLARFAPASYVLFRNSISAVSGEAAWRISSYIRMNSESLG